MAEALADAVRHSTSSGIERSIQRHGAALNSLTASEQTALHVAVWHRSQPAVQQLLEAGADVNARDGESGWTPLHTAVYQGSLAVASPLLRAGAAVDALDTKGRTPLDLLSKELQPFLDASATTSSHHQQLTVRQQVCAAGRPPAAAAAAAAALPDSSSRSQLFSWGNGANFQLGTGSTDLHLTPIRVDLSAAGTSNPASSTSATAPADQHRATSSSQAAGPERLVAVAAAKFHSCAVSDTGQLYTWGFGRGGRLGHPEFEVHSGSSAVILPRLVAGLGRRKVVCVSAAKHHSVAATSAGEVFSWGSNKDGRLGYPAVDNQPTPRKVALLRVRASWVAAANKHSVAVADNGEVYTWGGNAWGQLGYGTSDCTCNPTPRLVESMKGRRLVGVAAAKRHTVVLTLEGEVYTWGHRVVTARKVSIAGTRDTARAAAAGSTATAAAGTTAAAGPAAAGSLVATAADAASSGVSSSSVGALAAPLPAGAAAAAAAGSAGSSGAAGLDVRFHRGQSEVSRPVAVAVAAGGAHTTVLTRTGVVLTWRSDQLQPVVQEVLGALAGQRAVAVSAGKTRTAVVTAAGDVYIWEGVAPVSEQLLPLPSIAPPPAGGAAAPGAGSATSSSKGGSGEGWVTAVTPQSQSSSVGLLAESKGVAAGLAGGGGGGGGNSGAPPVVPQLVAGVKKVVQVAVGEKHSLAVQALWCPVLPADSQQHSSMVVTPRAGPSAAPPAAGGAVPGLQQRQRSSSDSLEYTAAADAAAAGSSDLDSDQEVAAAAAGAGRSQPPQRQQQEPHQDAFDPASWLPSGAAADSDAFHWEVEDLGSSSSSTSAVESLQLLSQRAVAQHLVEPRTVLPVLEYADMAGAQLLRSYCLAVAVGNLDVVLQEARHSFEGLSQQLLQELEGVYGALVLAPGSPALRSSSLAGTGSQQQQQLRGYLYPHLQPGKRPTACPPSSSEVAPAAADTYSSSTRSVLSVAVQALDAVRHTPDPLLPLPRPPIFRSRMSAAQDELEREAAAKLTRTCSKKLQQIGTLEARVAAGEQLDEQQQAKLALKAAWQSALRRLEAGWPAAEVAAVLAKAQEAAGLSSSLPAAPAGVQHSDAAAAAAAAGAGAEGPGGTSPVSTAPATDSLRPVSTAAAAAAAAAHEGKEPSASPAANSSTSGISSSKKGSSRASGKRVGGLSMFLTGALDAPPAAAASSSTTSSKEPAAPKAPAWGGVRPQPAAAPPLGGGGSEAAAFAASSSTAAAAQLQKPGLPGQGLPPVPAAPAAGVAGGKAAAAAPMPVAHSSSSSSSTGAAARSHQQQQASSVLGSSPRQGSSSLSGAGLSHAAGPLYGSSPPATTLGSSSSGSRPLSITRPLSSSSSNTDAAAAGSGRQVLLYDLLQQQKKQQQKAVAAAKAAEARSKAEPSTAPPLAWGGAGTAAAAAGSGDKSAVAAGPGVATPLAVKSLKEIQAEQEQVRATAGFAALQRDRAAAGGGATPGAKSVTSFGSPLPQPSPGQRSTPLTPVPFPSTTPSSSTTTPQGATPHDAPTATSSSSMAVAGASLQLQQLAAAGGLTAALAQSQALLGRSPGGSTALLGSSPGSWGRGSSWRVSSGGVGAGFGGSSGPGGRAGGGGVGGSSSSSFLLGSSPSGPSKWYTGDMPQLLPLTSIQLEQQEAAALEEETRQANLLIAEAEARERKAARAAARARRRAAAAAPVATGSAGAAPPTQQGQPGAAAETQGTGGSTERAAKVAGEGSAAGPGRGGRDRRRRRPAGTPGATHSSTAAAGEAAAPSGVAGPPPGPPAAAATRGDAVGGRKGPAAARHSRGRGRGRGSPQGSQHTAAAGNSGRGSQPDETAAVPDTRGGHGRALTGQQGSSGQQRHSFPGEQPPIAQQPPPAGVSQQ